MRKTVERGVPRWPPPGDQGLSKRSRSCGQGPPREESVQPQDGLMTSLSLLRGINAIHRPAEHTDAFFRGLFLLGWSAWAFPPRRSNESSRPNRNGDWL